MKEKNIKYNGSGSHRRAILHMIGQSEFTFHDLPTTAEIADWMNVSKVTARKYLKAMSENGELIMISEPYRQHAIHKWKLTNEVQQDFFDSRLLRDYRLYAQRVMKVILQ